MIRKHNERKKVSVMLLFFLFCFSCIIIYNFKNSLVNHTTSHNTTPNLENPTLPIHSHANLTQVGSGKTFDGIEKAWGNKTQLNLDETSYIVWETPGAWNGSYLTASITNLREILSVPEEDYADSLRPDSEGDYAAGSLSDTMSVDGFSYVWNWGGLFQPTQELNYTLVFEGFDSPYFGLSQIDINMYSFWNDSGSTHELVSSYIHNFGTGLYEYLGDSPQDTVDWLNSSKTSSVSNYISSSGEVWIQFHANATGGFGEDGWFYLDFIIVQIMATQKSVFPSGVNLTLDGNLVEGSIPGSGAILIPGPWVENPKYFNFSANSSLIFDVDSTFYIIQNKLGSVTSIYTLNLTQPIPASHQWKLEFNQSMLPSANFTSLNFSIFTLPNDWTLINATDPGGSQQTLNEVPIAGGVQLDADSGDITPGGGTWNIYYYSPNYIADIEIRKDSNLLPNNPFLLVWDTIDIRSVFSNPILNGGVNLTVSFEGKVNHSQEYNSVSGNLFNFASWQINNTANKNGTYLITTSFYNTTEIGIYTTQITVGFPTNLTLLSPDIRYVEFLKGDIINLTVFFENLFYPGNFYNEWGIINSQVKWEISNSTGFSDTGDLTPKTNGYYNASLDTGSIGVWDGSYNLTVTANKTTYVNQTHTIELLCFQIIHPTTAYITDLTDLQWISGMNYSAEVFPNQSLTIQMNYTDTFTSPRLVDNANISAYLYSSGGQLLSSYIKNGTRIALGLYEIDFSNLNLHVGQYTLLVNSSKKYYDNSSIWVNYTINPLDPLIKVSKLSEQTNITSYTEWENLTISFKVEYNSTQYNQHSSWDAPIDWALVKYYIVHYGDDPLNPSDLIKSGTINITPSGIFEMLNVHLSNGSGLMAPGDYEVYIHCNATDCQERWYNFNVTVLKKINVTLSIVRPPSKFQINNPITIIAKLYSAELPSQTYFDQKTVKFNVTVYYNSYAPRNFSLSAKADPLAEADVIFYLADHVPNTEDIQSMEYFAYFEGYEDFYPTYSFYSSISQTHQMAVGEEFPYWIIIVIVIGVAAGAMLLLVVQRRVLAPKQVQKAQSINYLFAAFKDVVGIQNLFVILKSTGDCILNKVYSPEGIEESMQTVLCNAIANYGKEDQRANAFCDLIRFQNLLLLVDDGDFIRAAVTVGSRPSDKLIRSLIRFVQFFELQNYQLLTSATGPIEGLQGVEDLLDLQFGSTLISPYTIGKISKVSGFDQTLALMAMGLMEDHGYFFLSQLYARAKSETLIEEMMIFSTIQNLLDKKVIIPYAAEKKPKGIPEEFFKEEIPEKIEPVEKIPELAPEPAPEPIPEKPSILEEVRIKSKEVTESIEPVFTITAAELMAEDTPELTPFEQAQELMRATDLMAEQEAPPAPEPVFEAPPLIDEITREVEPVEEVPPVIDDVEKELKSLQDALSIIEEFKPELEPGTAAESIVDEVLKEVEPIIQEPTVSFLTEELKAKPTVEEEKQIEEILQDIEAKPAEEVIAEKISAPSLSGTEIKDLIKLISESERLLSLVPKYLAEFNAIVQELTKQKETIKTQVKQTRSSVTASLNEVIQHLQVPRTNIEEEIVLAEKEIPKAFKMIDEVDQDAVNFKKNITSTQKTSTQLKETLKRLEVQIATIDQSLAKTTKDEMEKEKQHLSSFKTKYNEAIFSLKEFDQKVSSLNQEIVTLMIEDIEQMMALEQRVEKLLNEVSRKSKYSEKVREALSKENSNLNADIKSLKQTIILLETVFNEIMAQKKSVNLNVSNLEAELQKKVDELNLAIENQTKDSLAIMAESQALQNKILQNLQNIQFYQGKVEGALKKFKNMDKLFSNIHKRKNNIYKAIEKATKFVFPDIIQKQRAFFSDFNTKLQQLISKGQEFRQVLNSEMSNVSQIILPKVKSLPKILIDVEKKATQVAEELETIETREPQPSKHLIKTEKLDELLTDKELGIKQHCPYCNKTILENVMTLLRKGFEPECSNCGEKIKPRDIQLD